MQNMTPQQQQEYLSQLVVRNRGQQQNVQLLQNQPPAQAAAGASAQDQQLVNVLQE